MGGSLTLDRREIVKRALIDENRFENQHFDIESPRMHGFAIARENRYAITFAKPKREPITVGTLHRIDGAH
jgi:hypothetical protein